MATRVAVEKKEKMKEKQTNEGYAKVNSKYRNDAKKEKTDGDLRSNRKRETVTDLVGEGAHRVLVHTKCDVLSSKV